MGKRRYIDNESEEKENKYDDSETRHLFDFEGEEVDSDEIDIEDDIINEDIISEEEIINDMNDNENDIINNNEDIKDMDYVYNEDDIITDEQLTKDLMAEQFIKQKIITTFIHFINTCADRKYIKKIKKMCSENKESLYVSYKDMDKEIPALIPLIINCTDEILLLFEHALNYVVRQHFPNYFMIKSRLHVRIEDVPVLETIRGLRNVHLNTLIRVGGVVTRRSGVFPLLSIVKYTCGQCKAVFGPFTVDREEHRPSSCLQCQARGPFMVNSSETIYKDFQKLTLQEVPGTVPPGRLPRSKEVLLFYDLIDCARPGEEVEITGVYKNSFSSALNIKNGFPVFFTVIEAISVNKRTDKISMTEEDIREVIKMSKHPNIKNIIINSIAPSIYGHNSLKRALALAMFGGQQKITNDHVVRGDINVLLMGDPGTAKSQFLRYVAATAHRAVLANGQGASAVGLTASVHKDAVTREWTLEGGALVLADKGVVCIDEFDKMNETDRTSIHEAMEQQSISISKAGIVATLHARCSVIAAANPTRGTYNSSLTFGQNVNLSDPIISRFDVLCVVRDTIEQASDAQMADFVINSHAESQKEEETNETKFNARKMIMSQDLLKKYILYARTNSFPVIKEIDMEKISKLYAELRRESLAAGSVPITVRHVESIVRMSEAFARMKLRNEVASEDIDQAISVCLDSFIGAQKYAVTKNLRRKFAKYIEGADGLDVYLFVLCELFKDKLKAIGEGRTLSASINDFEKRLHSRGLLPNLMFYTSNVFKNAGFVYDEAAKRIYRN
ncbi:DNA replication licensing factor MCM2 [Astathelohania contejeani]|uniref:DNA replication licensing factor MCM2 n=1 Tax=Astathelohania contejeani TaxID=164912 RepID=A0ABQ7HVP6_9MICR|nr:DNA replication licensing factor MCM2 [Thelohania contejeani]